MRLTKRNNKGVAGLKGYYGLLTSYCYECTEEFEDGIWLLEDALKKLAEYEDLEEQGLVIKWIPFEFREMYEDEKECYGELGMRMFDCLLPDDDEEILVTYANGFVDTDIFLRDVDECYLDSGAEFESQAIAWALKPKPYKEAEQKLKELGE